MQFFSHPKPEDKEVQEPVSAPAKRSSFFGTRHRSPSPSHTRTSTGSGDAASNGSNPSRRRSVLARGNFKHGSGDNPDVDPSITQARERVMSAEDAEREADRALAAARLKVREAHAEVKRLEAEAAEESRRAKIKEYHAKEVSKRGKQLGRHGV